MRAEKRRDACRLYKERVDDRGDTSAPGPRKEGAQRTPEEPACTRHIHVTPTAVRRCGPEEMARFFFVLGWWCFCCVAVAIAAERGNHAAQVATEMQVLSKRSAAPESNHDDYPDYLLGVKYDEYPVIVPKKRAALLIDRLMVALQKAIEDEEGRGLGPRTKNYALRSDGMDLQRRGHQSVSGQKNGRYWRCYFNAVTCF